VSRIHFLLLWIYCLFYRGGGKGRPMYGARAVASSMYSFRAVLQVEGEVGCDDEVVFVLEVFLQLEGQPLEMRRAGPDYGCCTCILAVSLAVQGEDVAEGRLVPRSNWRRVPWIREKLSAGANRLALASPCFSTVEVVVCKERER